MLIDTISTLAPSRALRTSGVVALAASVVLGSVATANNDVGPGPRRGLAADFPAVAVISGTGNSGVRLKPEGDQLVGNVPQLPPLWGQGTTPVTLPDYSLDIPGLTTSVPGQGTLVIDGLSSGNGSIPPPSNGTPGVGGNIWLGISVSIADGSTPANGSVFKKAVNRGESTGGDIVTYYLNNSAGIGAFLPGTTVRETTRAQFGLKRTYGAGETVEDITALDYAMGINTYNYDVGRYSAFFSEELYAYFSVTRDSAVLLAGTYPQFAKDQNGQMQAPNGSDIYFVKWDELAVPPAWGEVRVWADGTQLGLDRNVDDVDAFDLNPGENVIVYSPRGDQLPAGMSQLMIVDLPDYEPNTVGVPQGTPDEAPQPMTETNGTRVTNKLGIGDTNGADEDEVDAICTIDPENKTYDPFCFTPRGEYSQYYGEPLGVSVCRGMFDSPSLDQSLIIRISGTGDTLPVQDAEVVLYEAALGGGWVEIGRDTRAAGQIDSVFTYPVRSDTPFRPNVTTFLLLAVLNDPNGQRVGMSFVGAYTDDQ